MSGPNEDDSMIKLQLRNPTKQPPWRC